MLAPPAQHKHTHTHTHKQCSIEINRTLKFIISLQLLLLQVQWLIGPKQTSLWQRSFSWRELLNQSCAGAFEHTLAERLADFFLFYAKSHHLPLFPLHCAVHCKVVSYSCELSKNIIHSMWHCKWATTAVAITNFAALFMHSRSGLMNAKSTASCFSTAAN